MINKESKHLKNNSTLPLTKFKLNQYQCQDNQLKIHRKAKSFSNKQENIGKRQIKNNIINQLTENQTINGIEINEEYQNKIETNKKHIEIQFNEEIRKNNILIRLIQNLEGQNYLENQKLNRLNSTRQLLQQNINLKQILEKYSQINVSDNIKKEINQLKMENMIIKQKQTNIRN